MPVEIRSWTAKQGHVADLFGHAVLPVVPVAGERPEWPVGKEAPAGSYAVYEGYLEFHGLCVGVNQQQVTWNFAVVQLWPCTEGANIQWLFQGDKLM